MAYTRLNLKDGDTLTAANMTHIEDELVALEDADSEINQSLTNYTVIKNASSISSILDGISSLEINVVLTFSCNGDCSSELTNGVASSSGKGFLQKNGSTDFDYLISLGNGGAIYAGRVASGTSTYCYRYGGTSTLSATAENSLN